MGYQAATISESQWTSSVQETLDLLLNAHITDNTDVSSRNTYKYIYLSIAAKET